MYFFNSNFRQGQASVRLDFVTGGGDATAIIIGIRAQGRASRRGARPNMTKINFGSGPYPLAGWINVDIDPAGRPDVVADLCRPLPFASGAADFIHTEDFLAQLDPIPLREFLRECRRILKPGGAMRVLTPDLARFARMYLENPAHLVWIWNTFVGVPLETGTACEVLNLGMRLAGRFQYDLETFSQLATRRRPRHDQGCLQRKPLRSAAWPRPSPHRRGGEHVFRVHAPRLRCGAARWTTNLPLRPSGKMDNE